MRQRRTRLQTPALDVKAIRDNPIYRPASQQLLRYYLKHGLKTSMDVYAMVTFGLGDPIIGTRKNCNVDDHCAPIEFISDVLLGKVSDFIVWANRSGSKSYFAGLLTWVRSSFEKRSETIILGGSLEQSEKIYKAMDDFWVTTGMEHEWLAISPMKRSTTWKNGSNVVILTASTKSVRGPHSQRLLMDEIDEMEEDVYISALSIPQTKYGIKASLGKLSTNHRAAGVMDTALAKAKDSGIKIYKWCIWETLQSCKDFSCSTCKLTPWCPGRHMKNADGYYSIDDFVQKLHELNVVTLQTEWFCDKVGRDDLVYGAQFDYDLHCPMDAPDYNDSIPVKLSIDWGGSNPFSVGAWQYFSDIKKWVRVDEVYAGNITNQKLILLCKQRPWWRKVREAVADPSRPDLIKEWQEEKVTMFKAINAVDPGIEAVRNCMAPVIGSPKFLVSRMCKNWIREVQSYAQKNGKPIKDNDHAMDDTRYFITRFVQQLRVPGVRRLN